MTRKQFLILIAIFFLHQLLQKGMNISFYFADAYLDDILCIPIILYLWNWEKSLLFNDSEYRIPIMESLVLTILLALLFEWGFPWLSPKFTYDKNDFLAYGAGWLLYHIVAERKLSNFTK